LVQSKFKKVSLKQDGNYQEDIHKKGRSQASPFSEKLMIFKTSNIL